MSEFAFIKQSMLFAATAFTTVGFLATAVPVQAIPPPALSPACDKWSYPTQSFELKQSNGIVVALYLRDDKEFDGPASHTVAGEPDVTGGIANGSLKGTKSTSPWTGSTVSATTTTATLPTTEPTAALPSIATLTGTSGPPWPSSPA